MALGAYGIKRPADVIPEDVQIVVHYQPSRDVTSNFILQTLFPASNFLIPHVHTAGSIIGASAGANVGLEVLGGLYDLQLPSTTFNRKGIYTVYIRPSEIRTKIIDCGILSSLPNVKGLVFDVNQVPVAFRSRFSPSTLVGYRVEYLNKPSGAGGAGTKIPNFFRIVTSNFYCEPVPANLTNANQVSPRYRYSDTPTNLVFCTLTPTSAPSNNPNALPFIGQPNQNVIITNTYFNPTVLEIEMVDHDFETLAIALYGNQTKSLTDGIYTLYDLSGANNIYKQYDLYEVRDSFDNQLFEVRQDRGTNIDFSKTFSTVTTL